MTLRPWFERLVSPHLGRCYRCNRPWQTSHWWGLVGVREHSTPFSPSQGCFPLCEGCWSSLTPAERLPFYRRLVETWIRQMPECRVEYEELETSIYEAVMAGK